MNPFLVLLLIGLTIMAALNWIAVWLQYRGRSSSVVRGSSFQPGEVVVTTRELNWSHGSGTVVPAGEELHLVRSYRTRCQFGGYSTRYDAHWYYDGEPVYVNSVPEDAICSSFVVRGSLLNQEQPTKNEQPVPSLKAQPEYPPLPLGVSVENQQLGWHWEVRSHFTDQLYESGTEPTELEARKMAFAAYDRSTLDSTPLAETGPAGKSGEEQGKTDPGHMIDCGLARTMLFATAKPKPLANEEPRTTNEEPQSLTTLQKFERGQPGFKERLRAQLAGKYRPQLVTRLFQLLETPIAELSTNDRRIINDLFASLCIIGTVDGLNRNRTSGQLRSADSGSHLSSLTSQPSSAG